MNEVIKTLQVAEKLLRSNRYLVEADMCKAAIQRQEKILTNLEYIRQMALAGHIAEQNNKPIAGHFERMLEMAAKAVE